MNWQTAVVAAVVAFIFVAIIAKMIKDKKNGKGMCSCGGGCSSCPMGDKCGKA